MATTSVNSATATAATNTQSTATERGMGSLKSEDFFKILVTELKQQDPFEPAKTADMINQVSQIRSIELSKQLTDTLSQLSQQQHTAGASELLGKYVTATVEDSSGTQYEVSGVVTGVSFNTDGSAVLELDTGNSILASDVTRITSVDNANTQTPATSKTAANSAKTAAASTTAGATNSAAQTANPSSTGLFPWLTLDAGIHL